MSQEYFSRGESSSAGSSSGRQSRSPSRPNPTQPSSGRPNYMTVGSGSASENAAALTAMLDQDSGYGGSLAEGVQGGGWHPGLTEDRPTPSHTPTQVGEHNATTENERRQMAGHIHQLVYNQNRAALGRSITKTIDTLQGLQEKNSTWPANYPSVQRSEPSPQRSESRPQMSHSQSMGDDIDRRPSKQAPLRPSAMKRSFTSATEDNTEAESSSTAEARTTPEPRLMSPQIAQEFSVLKLDLKLGQLSQTELVHSLEKQSIAALLDGKISQSIKHLKALRERIEDTSSKVLVTGDLNAGKSTFCNALLRRKVLPEDQQPCTSIFCEVLDARENGGFEEAHAVHKDVKYVRNDESTYDVYALTELEKVVIDNERYSQAKVYVKDIRTIDESLLNNGVVDISIIDAPGLNSDSLKTTAVFARQEEIDVVVFVVSAANHFTLSAKDFLWNAAHEKAYLFIVVNGYDTIKDKDRCQRRVLEQVNHLSPRTFKESSELVHFVSSNAIPVAPPGGNPGGGGPGGGGSGSASGPSDESPDDNDNNDSDGGDPSGKHGNKGEIAKKDKGKDKEKIQDFETLEQSLRRFVLEKRARSKLAPAKTYLLNVLDDINRLAVFNRDLAQSELERVTRELEEIRPAFEESKKAKTEVSDDLDQTIEETCAEVFGHTRSTLADAIARVAEEDLGVPYPGLMNAFQYADDLKAAMLDQISAAVGKCEETARDRTVQGVSSIKSLGLLHLGDEYNDLSFRSDSMFRRRRDALARQVDTEVEVWDFFDVGGLLQRQEKVAGTGMAMTVVGVLGGRLVGGVGWFDSALGVAKVLGAGGFRKMILPGMVLAVFAATAFVLRAIPTTLPQRMSNKISASLATLDYTHSNALRISSEVRKVLRFPADGLRVGLQRSVERLGQRREETEQVKGQSEVMRKYFSNLYRESTELKTGVERVDLEGPAPGVAAAYDS
ncbi:MAG: NADH:ubiquinone oxidoreductase [Chaenotheca gracillima]|nr:MAG: NADH:ubiquinone oxidoreductase [Chaenotheca gracillima]